MACGLLQVDWDRQVQGFSKLSYDNTNQGFEPELQILRRCLCIRLIELVVLLTGRFENFFYQLGIRPRAWLESTFIQRSKRGQYLKATTISLLDKHRNSQSVRATMVTVRVGSRPIMAISPNDVTAFMVLRNSAVSEYNCHHATTTENLIDD